MRIPPFYRRILSLIFLFSPLLFIIKTYPNPAGIKSKQHPSTNIKPPAPTRMRWRDVQKKAKDTVVQLFVYTSEFNWFEPYKAPKISRSWGSGFFIDNEGHIISNYHVVDEAANIQIQIPATGMERFDVEIVGASPERDVVLLKLTDHSLTKIKKTLGNIPFLELGDSDKVTRTQEVLSLGYPLGQEKLKSTQGIVSGRERIDKESYIQMTAALNEGISGGPCLNSKGKVIGINTAGIPKAQSIGYITPINDIKSVIKRLFTEKVARTPFLGVNLSYGSEAMLQYLGNPGLGGIYLARVYKDTLFDHLGAQEGDVIARINGQDLDFYGETIVPWSEDKVSIIDLVNRFEVGGDLNVQIYRKGKRLDLKGKLALTDELPIRKIYPEFETVDYEIIGGLVVMGLTLNHVAELFEKKAADVMEQKPYYTQFIRRDGQYQGRLIVTRIFPSSVAHRARSINEADLITEVNGQKVATLPEFRDAIRKGAHNKFISIKSYDKELTVLPIDEIVAQEDKLAARYLFTKSKLVDELGRSPRQSLLAKSEKCAKNSKAIGLKI